MGLSDTTLSPEDSRALLGAIARATALPRTDPRALQEGKRDIVLAMRGRPLLVATEGSELALRPASPSEGPVLPVFTDAEAAHAWQSAQHPDAPAVGSALSVHTPVAGEDWPTACRRRHIGALAVNPAGPLGAIVYATELDQARPRMLRRGRDGDDGPGVWLDLAERAAERKRVTGLLARLRDAVTGASGEDPDAIVAQGGDLNRMTSLTVAAELHRLGGQLRVRQGEYQPGVAELLVSANGWRLAADPWRATDTFWEAVAGLRALLTEGKSEAQRDWAMTQLDTTREALSTLALTGYRRDELVAWARTDRHGQ